MATSATLFQRFREFLRRFLLLYFFHETFTRAAFPFLLLLRFLTFVKFLVGLCALVCHRCEGSFDWENSNFQTRLNVTTLTANLTRSGQTSGFKISFKLEHLSLLLLFVQLRASSYVNRSIGFSTSLSIRICIKLDEREERISLNEILKPPVWTGLLSLALIACNVRSNVTRKRWTLDGKRRCLTFLLSTALNMPVLRVF